MASLDSLKKFLIRSKFYLNSRFVYGKNKNIGNCSTSSFFISTIFNFLSQSQIFHKKKESYINTTQVYLIVSYNVF